MHKNGIIYRDLKLENILVDEKGYVVLTDFKLAKKLEENQQKTNTIIGTPEYIAPEILEKKGYGVQADWWALGIVL